MLPNKFLPTWRVSSKDTVFFTCSQPFHDAEQELLLGYDPRRTAVHQVIPSDILRYAESIPQKLVSLLRLHVLTVVVFSIWLKGGSCCRIVLMIAPLPRKTFLT